MFPRLVLLLIFLNASIPTSRQSDGYYYDRPLNYFIEEGSQRAVTDPIINNFTKQWLGSQGELMLTSKQLNDVGCGAAYKGVEIRIQSPQFPISYPGNPICLYVVEAVSPNVCLLEVNFLTFDLGSCSSGDHVVIAGQSLCGSLGGIQTFRFSPPASLIQFRSRSGSGDGKGFDLLIRQRLCPSLSTPNPQCSGVFSNPQFVLQSPDYPAQYPNNVRCEYIIRPVTTAPQRSLCQAEFQFQEFRVVSSPGCTRDRLEIGDQDTVCGSLGGIKVYQFIGELKVNFFADDNGNDGNFRILVRQIGCTSLNIPPASVIPPQPPTVYPPYPPPTVKPPYPPPAVKPPYPPPAVKPPYPTVLPILPPIQPTIPTQPPVLPPVYPQTTYPPIIPSPSNYPRCCGRLYQGFSFLLASPGFPFGNRDENIDCVYEVRPYNQNVCRIKIVFKLFWIGEENSYSGCSGGFLEIDGRRYCGCRTGMVLQTEFGYQRAKYLRFRHDLTDRNSGGFLLEIFQESCSGWMPLRRADHGDVGDGDFIRNDNMSRVRRPDIYSLNNKNWQSIQNSNHEESNDEFGYVYSIPTVRPIKTYLHSTIVHQETYSNKSDTGAIKRITANHPVKVGKVNLTYIQESEQVNDSRRPHNNLHEDGSNITSGDETILSSNKKCIQNNSSQPVNELISDSGTVVNTKMEVETKFYNYSSSPALPATPKKPPHAIGDEHKIGAEVNLMTETQDRFLPKNIKIGTRSEISDDYSEEHMNRNSNEVLSDGVRTSACRNILNVRNSSDNEECGVNQQEKGVIRTKREYSTAQYALQYPTERLWFLGQSSCRIFGFAQWLLHAKQYFSNYVPQLLCPVQTQPGCQVFSETTGWIQSPNYPQSYASNSKHCYRFPRLSGYCQIQLTIADFSLENSYTCWKDYVSIPGKGRYCGQIPSTYHILDLTAATYADVVFVSDGYNSGRGFRIYFQQLPCNRRMQPYPVPLPPCNLMTSQQRFTLSSNDFLKEYDSCTYSIRRNSSYVCTLKISFPTFELLCGQEYLQIGDKQYCGPLSGLNVDIEFFGTELRIIYRRNGTNIRRKFVLHGYQVEDCDILGNVPLAARVSTSSSQCAIQLSDMRGFVNTPKFYEPQACSYVIQPQQGTCSVEMKFDKFAIPSSSPYNCSSGYLELQRRKFCNAELQNKTVVLNFNGHAVEVPFYARGTAEGSGWNFSYNQLPCQQAVQQQG